MVQSVLCDTYTSAQSPCPLIDMNISPWLFVAACPLPPSLHSRLIAGHAVAAGECFQSRGWHWIAASLCSVSIA